MIPLGLRLTLRGGHETVIRLVLLVAAVGLGTGLLLSAVSAINATNALNKASVWLWTGSSHEPPGPAATGTAPLWWHVSGGDMFRGQTIARVDVAATGTSSPVPPGIPHDPGPGQYYASPALAALLRSTPAGELADRYPGHLAGTIGDAALQSPNSLVIIVGRTPAQLAHTPETTRVTAIATALPAAGEPNPRGLQLDPAIGIVAPGGIDLIFSVVALAILTPILIFIATATRLSAARREQRFAAMRLAGATRRQVSVIAAVESTAAATGGMAAGFAVFFLLRVPLAAIPFSGQPFFPAQMSLSVPDIVAAAVGIPVAAAVAARLALRRVHVSPLGVARRVTPKPPTAWRLLPLLAGVAVLGSFTLHGRPGSVSGQVQAFFPAFLLIIVGLTAAGPWLTMAGARFMARRARRPGALIAARRLADDPRAAFRAVSGLVLALFITTVAVSVISTDDAKLLRPNESAAASSVLNDPLVISGDGLHAGAAAPSAADLARVRATAGVTGLVEVHTPAGLAVPVRFRGVGAAAGLASCAQLAGVPALGRCPAGAQTVAFPLDIFDFSPSTVAHMTWPAVGVPVQQVDQRRITAIEVGTNGSQRAIEGARTILENAGPNSVLPPPATLGEQFASGNALSNAYQQLVNVVIVTSLAIAGCTLAATIATGLADRKRPFSMLRLTGARLATLRRVVVLESAVPLLTVAAVAIGVGFGASAMFASVQMQHPLVAPGAEYYLMTGVGIAASLAIIAATFPLLRRITGPETARNE